MEGGCASRRTRISKYRHFSQSWGWWKFDLNIMSFVTTTTACCDRGRNVTQDQEEAIVKWRRALSVAPQQYIRPRNISIITTTVNNNRFGQFFLALGTISCAAFFCSFFVCCRHNYGNRVLLIALE